MTNQRGSVLPAVAFLFGAAVVVLIFGYMLWPKDEEIFSNSTIDANKVVNALNNANSNANAVNGNTNSSFATNTNAATNANTNTSADSTAGWKTYTNSTYKFSLQHPADWTVDETPALQSGTDFTGRNNAVFSIIADGIDLDSGNIIKTEAVTISGQEAQKTTRKNLGDESKPNYTVYVLTKYRDNGWTARNHITLIPTEITDIKTLDTILSTFTFTT